MVAEKGKKNWAKNSVVSKRNVGKKRCDLHTKLLGGKKKKYDPLSQSWLLRNRKESNATLVGVSDWV